MTVMTAPLVAAVRFHKVGKLYHFDSSAHPELGPGDYVIVETARGRQMGQIMALVPPEKAETPGIKAIKAPATARDLMLRKLWEAKEVEALIVCREASAEVGGLAGVKFVKAVYNYDGSTLTFLYTTEEEEQVNTNKLRRRLEQKFHSRLDLRRIGARDAARLLGEYGACGSPRCCSTHLTEFSPISIKMAKAQGISLTPSEITGMCGRLRCCLIYEYEQYVEANKTLPRVGKWIGTPHGEGKVIEVNPLKGTVSVIVDDVRHEVAREDLQHVEELRALAAKAGQGCAREGQAGPCECGARVRSGRPSSEQHPARTEQRQPKAEQRGQPPAQEVSRAGQEAARPDRQKRRRSRRGRGRGQGRPNNQPS